MHKKTVFIGLCLLAACSTADGWPDDLAMDLARQAGLADKDSGPDSATSDQAAISDASAQDLLSADIAQKPACAVTLCMAGAFTHQDEGNPEFGTICRQLDGVLEQCIGAHCYPRFDMLASDHALDRLIGELDADKNGRYDVADPTCEVRILGFSWGGVNAAAVAERFLADPRVGPSKRTVHKLVVIDPFAPLAQVRVAQGVQSFWEYRHSQSPTSDCSADAFLGPYRGLAPSCHQSVRCRDYDYSLAPTEEFNGYLGAQVGHCTVVSAAAPAVLHNIRTGLDHPDAPPQLPVARF